MSSVASARINRRQLITSAVGGALFGAAWGLALGEALTYDSAASVTVVWSRSGFAVLVEHQRRRVMLLHSGDADRQRHLTQLVTGFIRQRVDVLLASDTTLQALSPEMKERWRLARFMAIEPDTAHPQIGFADQQIQVGDLKIVGRRLDFGAWGTDAAPLTGWYLELLYGDGLIVIVPGASALQLLKSEKGAATVIVVLDEVLEALPLALSEATIAAPADAPVFDVIGATNLPIRLFHDSPVSFGLSGSGVVLLSAG